jgi:hypothetical protein
MDNWGLSTDLPVDSMAKQDASCSAPPKPGDMLLGAVFPMCATSVPLREKLPALRIGGEYKVRLRTVDLAGNGLGPDDWPEDGVDSYWIGDPDAVDLRPMIYRRWEPVGAPQLLLERQLDLDARPGDSLETIVLREGAATPTVDAMLRRPAFFVGWRKSWDVSIATPFRVAEP